MAKSTGKGKGKKSNADFPHYFSLTLTPLGDGTVQLDWAVANPDPSGNYVSDFDVLRQYPDGNTQLIMHLGCAFCDPQDFGTGMIDNPMLPSGTVLGYVINGTLYGGSLIGSGDYQLVTI